MSISLVKPRRLFLFLLAVGVVLIIVVAFLIIFMKPIIVSYSRSQWSHTSNTVYVCANGSVFEHRDGGYVNKESSNWYVGRIPESEMSKLREGLGLSFYYSGKTSIPLTMDTGRDVRLDYRGGGSSRVISVDEYFRLQDLVDAAVNKAVLSDGTLATTKKDSEKRVFLVDCLTH